MKKILIILIGFILLSSCNNATGINDEEIKQVSEQNVLSKEQLTDLLYSKNIKDVQFIDIRTPHKYVMGHLPNAINIPMKNFFNEKYFSKKESDKYLILYGDDASTPGLLALISEHFNKGNFYIALGGYDYIKKNILDGFGIYSATYDDEEPLVDFAKKVNEIRSRAGGSIKSTKPKKTMSKPMVKPKKKEASGGC